MEPLRVIRQQAQRCPLADSQFRKRTTRRKVQVRLTFAINISRVTFSAVELHNLDRGRMLIGQELP